MALTIKFKQDDKESTLVIPEAAFRTIGRSINVTRDAKDQPSRQTSPYQSPYEDIQGFGDTAFPQLEAMQKVLATLDSGGAASKNLKKITDGLNKSISVVQKQAYNFFSAYDDRYRAFVVSIQDQIGGFPVGAEEATNELARRLEKGYDNIATASTQFGDNLNNMHLTLDLDTGEATENVNLITAALGGSTKVLEKYQSLILRYGDTLGPKFTEALEDQEYQVARLEKGLGLSQENIATLLRREIATTGEASTKMLDDIEKFSYATADATGGNAKLIAQQTAQIIGNVKDFGNVTVEEASRIAAAVQKTGIEFSSFNTMLGKFQGFESATTAMSDLTSVFGIHMDSMELMMLANEDQEQFLYRIKEGFEEQGLAMEDMNLAQKKVLADTIGMSVEQAEIFFQEGSLPDQAAMQEATITASAEDAIERLNKDMVNIVHKGGDLNKILTQGIEDSFVKPVEKAAYRNANRVAASVVEVGDALKKATNETNKELLNTFDKIETGLEQGIATEAGQNTIKGALTSYGDALYGGIKDGLSKSFEEIKGGFSGFYDSDWFQTNILGRSPSKLFGWPIIYGIRDAIPYIESDMQDMFLGVSNSMSQLVAETGLPSLLDDLNEATTVATGIVGDRLGGVSESIEVLNAASVDNLPKMVEKLDQLNSMLERHVKSIEEGTNTEMAINLMLETEKLYTALYSYRHPSAGSVQFNTGEAVES